MTAVSGLRRGGFKSRPGSGGPSVKLDDNSLKFERWRVQIQAERQRAKRQTWLVSDQTKGRIPSLLSGAR